MDFLFINTEELSALEGLPHIQQLTYLIGIRPYMDRRTFIVGIKRKISYQSLSEALYVEPHQGIQSGSPSKPQMRRVVKGLEQAGLVQIQSTRKNLILSCLLANAGISVQNKPVIKPSSYPSIIEPSKKPATSISADNASSKAGIDEKAKAVIPHNSDNFLFFLNKKFEKFWSKYPQHQHKDNAWEIFKKLNPDDALFSQIITALEAQCQRYEQLQSAGIWQPAWKQPSNWLAKKCWNDDLTSFTPPEPVHEKNTRTHDRKTSLDVLWESCKKGAQFSLGDDEYGI